MESASTHSRINAVVAPAVEALGFELVGVELGRNGQRGLVRVYIDSDAGISVDDCARVSHQVSGALDVEDPIGGEYDLEVSSPGLDRPLFAERDFARFAGERARVRLHAPIEGRRRFAGTLGGVADGAVLIESDGEIHRLPVDAIASARLDPRP